jgi:hypothetical protein
MTTQVTHTWKDAKKTLPEKEGLYLTIRKSTNSNLYDDLDARYFDGKEFHGPEFNIDTNYTIVYWDHIPALPEGIELPQYGNDYGNMDEE